MKLIEILRLTYNGQKSILNLTKQSNSTKLSRMTHLRFKESRIRGVRGGCRGQMREFGEVLGTS